MERLIGEAYTGRCHVLVKSGANVSMLTERIVSELGCAPYTHVMVQVGVNEINTKLGKLSSVIITQQPRSLKI